MTERKVHRLLRRARLPLFAVYLLVLFKLLFFKLTVVFSDIAIAGNEKADFESLLEGSNFQPFFRIYYYLSGQEPYLVGLLNLAGNVILFVPMGIFLPLFFKPLRHWARLLFTVALISLWIEVLQLLTATGQFDIDDVILNAFGGWLGYGLMKAGVDRREGFNRKQSIGSSVN